MSHTNTVTITLKEYDHMRDHISTLEKAIKEYERDIKQETGMDADDFCDKAWTNRKLYENDQLRTAVAMGKL